MGREETILKSEKGSFPYYTLAKHLVELMSTITWKAYHAFNELLASGKRLRNGVLLACIGC